ncbi:MAG: class I SAM-dependent methyltransferase [Desulfobacteraceae bacterium]|nr:MAG: class I SAM-dependent methyltransferase [Desulfobacteraceae bacterium]
MKLSYLKYLKCFCGSDHFDVYRIEKDQLKKIRGTEESDVLSTGFLRCGSCNKCYPVSEGILTALPDCLCDDESAMGQHAGLEETTAEQDRMIVYCKKNEIKVRNAQAAQYHTFGYWVYGLNEARAFRNAFKSNKEDVIAELGCGTGRITREIVGRPFKDYFAIDFSMESLRLLRSQLSDECQDNILFMKADVCRLPLKADTVHKVVSAQVLEHIPGPTEQQKFVKEIQRVLRVDGTAVLTTYNYNLKKRFRHAVPKKGFHGGKIYFENFTFQEIKKLFQPHLKIDQLGGINCFFPFAKRFNAKTQMFLEFILARSGLSRLLGDLLFVRLKKQPGA